MKNELCNFWRSNGWPSFNEKKYRSHIPPIRQLAERSLPGVLEIVYDFIYRLTSGEVHSNPRALLRLGWGNSETLDKFPDRTTFSTSHLGLYHLKVIQIYGAYLLCLWLELVPQDLGINKEEQVAVVELRKYLLSILRWPEMVTFEEMNVPRSSNPIAETTLFLFANPMKSFENGFIAAAEHILEGD